MSVALTGDGPNISLTGSGSSFTITVTTGGAGGVSDHGALTGLADDDHTQYALADGSRGSFAAASHTHAASDITSGTMATARLGSGTASSSTFLRGDQTYATPTVDVVSNVATSTILGRLTAGSGDSEELTAAQVRSLLGVGWRVLSGTTFAGSTSSVSVDVTGVSMVRILFAGASTRASNSDTLDVTINSLTTTIYGNDASALTSALSLGTFPATTTNTDRAALITAELHLLSGFVKQGRCWFPNSFFSTSTGGSAISTRGLVIYETAAATSLQVFSRTGSNFTAGSVLIIEGLA